MYTDVRPPGNKYNKDWLLFFPGKYKHTVNFARTSLSLGPYSFTSGRIFSYGPDKESIIYIITRLAGLYDIYEISLVDYRALIFRNDRYP